MAECKSGCGENFGNDGYRRYLDLLDQRQGLYLMPPQLVAAVIEKESGGFRWFNRTDKQFHANCIAVEKYLRMPRSQFLSLIVARTGPTKGLIPKFRVEPGWVAPAKKISKEFDNPFFWEHVLPLSYGFGQKYMHAYLEGYTHEQWSRLFSQFLADPYLQIKQCAKDVAELVHYSNGDIRLALTRYNAGKGAKSVSEYGKVVFDNFQRKLHESQGG